MKNHMKKFLVAFTATCEVDADNVDDAMGKCYAGLWDTSSLDVEEIDEYRLQELDSDGYVLVEPVK